MSQSAKLNQEYGPFKVGVPYPIAKSSESGYFLATESGSTIFVLSNLISEVGDMPSTPSGIPTMDQDTLDALQRLKVATQPAPEEAAPIVDPPANTGAPLQPEGSTLPPVDRGTAVRSTTFDNNLPPAPTSAPDLPPIEETGRQEQPPSQLQGIEPGTVFVDEAAPIDGQVHDSGIVDEAAAGYAQVQPSGRPIGIGPGQLVCVGTGNRCSSSELQEPGSLLGSDVAGGNSVNNGTLDPTQGMVRVAPEANAILHDRVANDNNGVAGCGSGTDAKKKVEENSPADIEVGSDKINQVTEVLAACQLLGTSMHISVHLNIEVK